MPSHVVNTLSKPAIRLNRPDLLRHQAFIGGSWVEGEGVIDVVDPATGQVLGQVPDVGASGTQAAIGAASEAFLSWRSLTAAQRGAKVRRWAELMQEHRTDLARIMVREQGKPMREAAGEVDYAASFLLWFAEEALRTYGDVIPGHAPGKRLTVVKQPVGVVAAVTPWNFPLAMITRKAGPALAAGCPVVVKPSELTPFSALAMAVLAQEAGLPPGIFNIATGAPEPIGDVLTSDPRVRKFTFTGSTAVGAMLASRCMQTVKRVSLELGGNAPFVVFDDADMKAALDGAMIAKFRNSGQTCVCANRIYVQAGCYDEFVGLLAGRVRALRVGSGLDDGSDIGPLIDNRAIAKVERHVADALSRGGQLLAGGARQSGSNRFFQPTLIADVPPDALLCREETFGPVAGVVRFDHEQEALALANATGGLAAYFFTSDHRRVLRFSDGLEAGMIGVNTGLISTAVAPFGGVKQAGIGREGSKYGIDEYLELKLLCDDEGESL